MKTELLRTRLHGGQMLLAFLQSALLTSGNSGIDLVLASSLIKSDSEGHLTVSFTVQVSTNDAEQEP